MHPHAYKSAFAALLIVSLAGKAFTRQPPDPDRRKFAAAVERRLTGAGFRVARLDKPSGPYVFGTRGRCRLMVAEQDAVGTLADRHRQFAQRVGTAHFVWQGRRLAEVPRAAVLAHFLAWREQVRIGLSPHRSPLAVAADNGACGPAGADPMIPASLPL